MTFLYRIIRPFLMILVIQTISGTAFAQKHSLETQERDLLSMKARLDSLQAVHVKHLEEAESLARLINLTRSRKSLSSSEHRILQRQLQESQRLETLVREIESSIEKTERSYRSAIVVFADYLQEEIVSTIDKIERGDDLEAIERFQALLEKKSEWESRLIPPPMRGRRTLHVKADEWDTPGSLELKGDLLLDQEEILRGEVKTVENRIHSLEEEERIRRKVSELTRNIYLFDEREELMGKEINNQANILSQEIFYPEDRSGATLSDLSTSSAFYETIQRVLSGPTPRSPDELNAWIHRLRQYRDLLAARADSLNQQADWFFNEAKIRRE